MSKADAQRIHVRQRALERFGVNLGPNSYEFVINQIRCGAAVAIEKQSHRITKFCIELPDGTMAAVIYDKKRKTCVTVIPLNLEEEWASRKYREKRAEHAARKGAL